MAVYVDDMFAPYRGMKMCHMVADSSAELLDMALKIGVQTKWIQYPGTKREHFDIATSKRKLAIEAGAVEITRRQLGARLILMGDHSERARKHAESIWKEVQDGLAENTVEPNDSE